MTASQVEQEKARVGYAGQLDARRGLEPDPPEDFILYDAYMQGFNIESARMFSDHLAQNLLWAE